MGGGPAPALTPGHHRDPPSTPPEPGHERLQDTTFRTSLRTPGHANGNSQVFRCDDLTPGFKPGTVRYNSRHGPLFPYIGSCQATERTPRAPPTPALGTLSGCLDVAGSSVRDDPPAAPAMRRNSRVYGDGATRKPSRTLGKERSLLGYSGFRRRNSRTFSTPRGRRMIRSRPSLLPA